MVGYPFMGPSGSEIQYSVGNPMGAYSSWSSFALSHHFVMYWCCQELNISWLRARYVILGDDVLIGDARLAEIYKTKIKSLGVEIAPQKTYESFRICEFAKRFLYEGEEVTPFPVSAVIDNMGDVSLLTSAIMGESRKGYIPRSGIPGCVESLSRIGLGGRKSFRDNLTLRAVDSESSTLFLQGLIEPVDFLLRTIGGGTYEGEDVILVNYDRIIREAVHRVLVSSLFRGPSSIDTKVQSEVRKIMTLCMTTGANPDFILDLPLVRVMRRFEEAVPGLEEAGGRALLDLNEVQVEYLGGFFVNPLSDTAWGLDKRQRSIKG